MCGIFSLTITKPLPQSKKNIKNLVCELYKLSETRGREAAGVVATIDGVSQLYKEAFSASEFIKQEKFNDILDSLYTDNIQQPSCLIGHARLVTNGRQTQNKNNQPVQFQNTVGVHNGIIVNDNDIWEKDLKQTPNTDVDSEALMALLEEQLHKNNNDIKRSLSNVYQSISGTASFICLTNQASQMVAASNNGSLYKLTGLNDGLLVLASEKLILKKIVDKFSYLFADVGKINQISINEFVTAKLLSPGTEKKEMWLTNHSPETSELVKQLKRCKRCLLPETMPFISYDEHGVCNYCCHHEAKPLKGKQALESIVESYVKQQGSRKCLVAFSGGRDSCYGLYYVKKVLGLEPIAFTYDWGMVTNIARRNQARMCGELGVEHIIVSADLRKKRNNIKRNVEAWLKKPHLGMVPIFTAGDKLYYYYLNKLSHETGIDLIFMCENGRFEQTRFKAGFCGVNEGMRRIFNISLYEKFKLAIFYAGQFVKNPRYLNRSLLDTFKGFLASYFIKHDYIFLFDYIKWDEKTVNNVLINQFKWELADDTKSTWRIGDGTAAFYNYIYYTLAGFTEYDTFRSNQIRENCIDRGKALEKVNIENQTRWKSMYEYLQVIGVDSDYAIQKINSAKKLI